jgi:hypothetical protein
VGEYFTPKSMAYAATVNIGDKAFDNDHERSRNLFAGHRSYLDGMHCAYGNSRYGHAGEDVPADLKERHRNRTLHDHSGWPPECRYPKYRMAA